MMEIPLEIIKREAKKRHIDFETVTPKWEVAAEIASRLSVGGCTYNEACLALELARVMIDLVMVLTDEYKKAMGERIDELFGGTGKEEPVGTLNEQGTLYEGQTEVGEC